MQCGTMNAFEFNITRTIYVTAQHECASVIWQFRNQPIGDSVPLHWPVMRRRKLLDDIMDFDESFFIRCCWYCILQSEKTKRDGEINGGSTNIKLSHLSTQVHAAAWSMEGTSVYSRTPLPHPAAITTSKHLLHLQGRLCCAWRGFSFQVTHTERFAAYVMIGCVKLILWFQGCLWLRTVRSIWEIPTSEMWGIFFLFFFIESWQKYKISTLSVILPVSSERFVSIENQDNLKSKILRWLADLTH